MHSFFARGPGNNEDMLIAPTAVVSEHVPSRSFLLLSTSLLVDRVFLYTGLIKTLREQGQVSVWASSFGDFDAESSWADVNAHMKAFPSIRAFKEIPHNFLRRLNEYVWDYRYLPPS